MNNKLIYSTLSFHYESNQIDRSYSVQYTVIFTSILHKTFYSYGIRLINNVHVNNSYTTSISILYVENYSQQTQHLFCTFIFSFIIKMIFFYYLRSKNSVYLCSSFPVLNNYIIELRYSVYTNSMLYTSLSGYYL